MKKKIKDFTEDEFYEFCSSHDGICTRCPLRYLPCDFFDLHRMNIALETEVEIK